MSAIKIRLMAITILLLIILFFHFKVSYYSAIVQKGATKTLICVGEIEKIDTSEQVDQILTMKVKSGWFRGERITVDNKFTGRLFGGRVLHKGDKLFLEIPLKSLNQERIEDVYLREYVRTPFLLYLVGAFGCLLILVGGLKGIKTILSLITTSVIILYIFVPLLLEGYNPILIAVIISSIVTLFKFVWITGKSPKVISGTLGTLLGLAACALLATYSKNILHFTGLDEKFGYLKLGVALWRTIGPAWDYPNILVAGMIVGAVGAMMDVAMSISSSVVEVKKANPNISVKAAIRAGHLHQTGRYGVM
ncbi:TPA: YibE/F family protein [Candidatus Poribacteria bacterium]|nr:YibE/F family protein [Candidatus Poribacteria bacterium]